MQMLSIKHYMWLKHVHYIPVWVLSVGSAKNMVITGNIPVKD